MEMGLDIQVTAKAGRVLDGRHLLLQAGEEFALAGRKRRFGRERWAIWEVRSLGMGHNSYNYILFAAYLNCPIWSEGPS